MMRGILRSRENLILVASVLLLFVMGLAMVFNTNAAEVLNRLLPKSTYHALIKQLLYAIVGGLGAVGVWFLGYDHILKLSGFFLAACTFLLLLVFVPGIGSQINGAHRWLGIGGYSLQPSEFAKYLIPMYYIQVITTAKSPILLKDLIRLLAKLGIPLALILVEPDNGTTAIILVSLVVLFMLTRVRWVYWGLPLLIFIGSGALVASQMPHVKDRIRIYLNPELDLQGKGHQPYQAKIAAGSGGLLGKGIGQSLQKLDYLPEARNDYIAAIYAEEFGFMGMLGLVVLYMLIGYAGFSIAFKAADIQAFYLVAIITFLICFQAFLNLGVVSGLLPSKGTNLPFFSQGGSSLMVNLMMVCVVLNVSTRSQQSYA